MKKVRLVKLPCLLYTIMLLVPSSYLSILLYFNVIVITYNCSYTAEFFFFVASSGAEKNKRTRLILNYFNQRSNQGATFYNLSHNPVQACSVKRVQFLQETLKLISQ